MDNNELERREHRRKRRKRAQLLAYFTLLILIVILAVIGYFGVVKIRQLKTEYDERVAASLAEAANALEEVGTEENEAIDEALTEEAASEPVTDEEPEITTDELDELVDVLIADMTLEEKLAGLFIVSPEALTGVTTQTAAGNSTKNAIEANPVGGFIFTSKNYLSATQFQEMITNMNGYSKFPLFTAIDREPGNDTSFGITQTDNTATLTDTANVNVVFSLLTEGLTHNHLNTILAPVADIVAEDGNKSLQGRTFGTDGESVSPLVSSAVKAIEEKANSVVKTFPGEGSVSSDNELTKSVEELKNAELLAFKGAVDAKASAIIVSNLYATGICGERIPACLSDEVVSLLREYLGFNGIIMTDYLNDTTVTSNYSAKDAAIAAINAGCDMLLCPKNYKEAYNGLLEAVNAGSISEDRINEALHRIYRVKYKDALDS